MIEGFVNEDLEPVIEVGLVAEDRVERTFAIIDVLSGRIIFDEMECEVLVIISTSSDVLIGTSLLKTKTLFVDFIDRRVEVKDKEV